MIQHLRIPIEQTINGTTVHIDFSDAPAGTGMEQILSILSSSCAFPNTEKEVDKLEAA